MTKTQSPEDEKISNPLQLVLMNATITIALITVLRSSGLGWVPTAFFAPMLGAGLTIGLLFIVAQFFSEPRAQSPMPVPPQSNELTG